LNACWSVESVDPILSIEALTPDPGVFLATHVPFSRLVVDRQGIQELGPEPDEERLRAVLSAADRRHAFCVVEGEPGTGKSHLIRWLYLKWLRMGDARDVPLLIARGDGSLEGTLRRMNETLSGLGYTAADLRARLSQLSQVTEVAKRDLFKSTLARSFRADFFVTPFEDAEWCSANKLDKLFSYPRILERWHSPDHVLDILSGQGSSGGRRDSELGAFTADDVRLLAAAMDHVPNMAPAHIRLKAELRREAESSEPLDETSTTSRIVRALNGRLNPAVQGFLGVSPNDLKNAFRQVRRDLLTANKRLILFLEDITNFQGVDEALLDVLIADARLSGDECDIVSIVGVTPGYVRDNIRGRGNYIDRFTHHIRLSQGAATGGYEQSTVLESPEAQLRFASRYMNAVRLGPDVVRRDGDLVQNACPTCPQRPGCHEAFGEVDGYGLFPLTKRFIVGNFTKLVDPERRQTLQTPRGLLQGLLAPVLAQGPAIQAATFPDARLKGAMLRHAGVVDTVRKDQIANLPADPAAKERLRLFLSLWDVNSDIDSYNEELPSSVFDRLQLPVPFDQSGRPKASRTSPEPPDKRKGPSPLQRKRLELEEWRKGRPLAGESDWRSLVSPHVRRLAFLCHSVPALARRKILTDSTWAFKSTGNPSPMFLVLQPEEWVIDGLEALIVFNAASRAPETLDNYVVRSGHLAVFLSRLRSEINEHLELRWRTLCTAGGEWNPTRAAVQLAGMEVYLSASAQFDASVLPWWQSAMTPNRHVVARPRSELWTRVVERLSGQSDIRRDTLTQLLALPVGTELRDSDPLNGAAALRYFKDLSEELRPADAVANVSQWPAALSAVAQIGSTLYQVHDDILEHADSERQRLTLECQQILTRLRQSSIAAHLRRVEQTVAIVNRELPTTEPRQVGDWKASYEQASRHGLCDEGSQEVKRLEGYLATAELANIPHENRAEVLRQCVVAPVEELSFLSNILWQAEKIVSVLLPHVKNVMVGDKGSEEGIRRVSEFGARLGVAMELLS
jgi:hypothetical protein